ncbi:hypothetical protein AOLI_G00094490 [Acnodon oligacanthus]
MCNTAPLHVQLAQAASGQQLDFRHSQRKSPAWSIKLCLNSNFTRSALCSKRTLEGWKTPHSSRVNGHGCRLNRVVE